MSRVTMLSGQKLQRSVNIFLYNSVLYKDDENQNIRSIILRRGGASCLLAAPL